MQLPIADKLCLGFYWHEMPEPDAFRMLAGWISGKACLEAEFEPTYSGASASPYVKWQERQKAVDQTMERAAASFDEPIPGKVRFVAFDRLEDGSLRSVPAWITYAPSLPDTGRRVLELVFDLARAQIADGHGVRPEPVDSSEFREPGLITFAVLCLMLSPHYAGRRTTRELLAPRELVNSDDPADYDHLHLGANLVAPGRVQSDFSDLDKWGVLPLTNGTALQLDPETHLNPAQLERGMELIRGYLRPLI